MRRRYLALVAMVMLVAPSAALGSATTKPQYLSKADASCKRGNTSAGGYESQVQKLLAHQPTTVSGLKTWAAKVSKIIDEDVTMRKEMLQRLRALPAPAGGSMTVAHIWNALGSELVDLQTFSRELRAFQFSSLKASEQRAMNAKTKYDALAQRFGFKVCGEPAS